MPSIMMHLLTAKNFSPDLSALFYLGTIAPDTISTWVQKDISHFRNLTDSKRSDAMADLATHTDKEDDFREGILLHLYLDWKWDLGPFLKFKVKYIDENWFPLYRQELALTSTYLYYTMPWSKTMWDNILAVDPCLYDNFHEASPTDIRTFAHNNYQWHLRQTKEFSTEFPPDYVEQFCLQTANEYSIWRTKHS